MKKIILSGVVIVLILGIAAGAYWWLRKPQVITFSDDCKLTLLGADYGKRHAPPGGKLPAAPARPATATVPVVRRNGNGAFTTPTDALVVWFRAKYDQSSNTPNQNLNFQFYLFDKAGTACAEAYGNVQQGAEVFSVQFPAFPRRQGQLYLRVQENANGGQEMADNKFIINNPATSKSFPIWTPEPLPVTKEDDGLSVTMTKLVSGADLPYQRVQDDPDDVINKGVQVAYRVERGGKPVTNWQPASVEITDATGNRTAINYGPNGNQAQWSGDEAALTLQSGLWPDEPAWKLRMEMTQTADFSSDEQWAAQNIPVVPGSQQSFNALAGMRGGVGRRGAAPVVASPPDAPTPCAEADLGGHHIKIFPAVQFTNMPANMPANFVQPQQTGLMIQVQPAVLNFVGRPINVVNGTQMADDGLRLTLAKVTDGQGGDIQSYNSGSSTTGMGGANSTSTFRYMLRETDGVTNINVTIAMHKNHFFEFTVKPEKAAAQ